MNGWGINMKLNKIYNEDCMDTMARMGDNFIDLTVTSPPYDNLRTYNDNIDETWDQTVWKPIIKELYRVTKEGGVVVWVVGDATIDGSETGTSFRQALWAKKCGFNLHDTMIYKKKQVAFPEQVRYNQSYEYSFVLSKGKPKTFNQIKIRTKYSAKQIGKQVASTARKANGEMQKMKYETNKKYRPKGNIWEYGTGMGQSYKDKIASNHSAVFPEDLAKDHIYSWSNKGDLIYDPFMGSGTTAKMAHLLKRKWIGSEISSEYVELANKRLQPYISQKTLF